MLLKVVFTLLILACTLVCGKAERKLRNETRKFPEHFRFGAATAAYQIEGAWNVDGKTESIWDRVSHKKPCIIHNCETGDVAANSYYLYKRDVEMIRELGLDFYRFSISWPRILPTSFPDKINEAGVNYYNNLINELLKYNIEPIITLYHWELPQKLQNLGGWANPNISDWFSDYARVVFSLFGDRINTWLTINEPRAVCYQGYSAGTKAPHINMTGYAEYLCAKNLLVAHAKVYHLYNNEFRRDGTKIGIVISGSWHEPDSEKDIEATEEVRQFEWGQYAHPIFSTNGGWPPIMKEKVATKSAEQGFFRSRLPEFTSEEIAMIKGTADFFGLNQYTTVLVYRNESVIGRYPVPSYYDDISAILYQPTEWKYTYSGMKSLKIVPWGFYKFLTKIREDYGNPPVYILENGCSTGEGLEDEVREEYIKLYLDAMLDAIEEGSDVQRYTVWSLMDNFEWDDGYADRFGLYEVDFTVEERTRTPRKSAYLYKEILRTRTLNASYEPDLSVPMKIDEGH